MIENERVNADNKKCYSCGKVFKTVQHLNVHKNRKTPCLIREITAEQRMNPNRCIFCNKIFSTKGNLQKHLGLCKIKNGGMDILDEKVRYEQEIRILKERDQQKDEEIKEMREQMHQLQEKVAKLETAPVAINNITNNITNNTINQTFNFYNYDNPFIDTLKFTQDDLLVTNIARKVIEMVYFNKDLPQNHTLYLPNIKEKRLLVYKNGTWQTVSGENISDVMTTVKNKAFLIGNDKINGGAIYASDQDFERLYPAVRTAIRSFNQGHEHANVSDDEILDVVTSNKKLIAETLRREQVV